MSLLGCLAITKGYIVAYLAPLATNLQNESYTIGRRASLGMATTALYEQRKGGNHRFLTDEQVADIRAKLQQYRPLDVLGEGHVATADGLHWTVADLKPALARWQGVTYQSDTSYRTLLKRCGYSYQRAGKQFRSCGQTPMVRCGPGRAKVNFYGKLNLQTGEETVTQAEVMNSATTSQQHLICYV